MQSAPPLKFSPTTQNGLQVKELEMNAVISNIQNTGVEVVKYDGKYQVNFGANRYHVLKRDNFTCACCGVKANRCFLDKDEQQSELHKFNCYHVNFYAETGDYVTGQIHYVLMTKDHIVAKINGGSDDMENLQTLCFNCNSLKQASGFTLEQMRACLFPAYRAYRSSISRTKTREMLHEHYFRLEKLRKTVDAITNGLDRTNNEQTRIAMKDKLLRCQSDAIELEAQINQIEMDAQVTGVIPDEVPKLSKYDGR